MKDEPKIEEESPEDIAIYSSEKPKEDDEVDQEEEKQDENAE